MISCSAQKLNYMCVGKKSQRVRVQIVLNGWGSLHGHTSSTYKKDIANRLYFMSDSCSEG